MARDSLRPPARGRLAGFFALVLLGGAIAGCGSDSGAGAARKAFRSKANEICAQVNSQTRQLAEQTFKGLTHQPSQALQREYARRSEAVLRRGLDRLEQLTPPPGDEQRVREILRAGRQALSDVSSLPPGEPGNPSAAERRFRRLARDYGLDKCAGR